MKEWLKAESIKDTEKFYESKYLKDGLEAFKQTDWNFFYDYVARFFPGGMRVTDSILDCGCGGGHFLKNIFDRYPKTHPYLCGIELSPTAAGLAQENLKGHAYIHNADYLNFDDDCFKDNSFDIVTCFGTIEHSPDIMKALGRIFSYAKPGGIIMITFPLEFDGCMTAIENEENKKNNERFAKDYEWLAIVKEHINPFFSQQIGTDLLMVFRKWVSA